MGHDYLCDTDVDEPGVWDRVEKGVMAVFTKVADGSRFSDVEGIREALREGDARLLLASDGFVIWFIEVEGPGPDARITFRVWIAYGSSHDFLRNHEGELEALARISGATRMVFDSPRPAFRRMIRGTQWRIASTEYERDL